MTRIVIVAVGILISSTCWADERETCECIHAEALLPHIVGQWQSERELLAAGPGQIAEPDKFCATFKTKAAHEVCLHESDPSRTAAVFSDRHLTITVNYAVLNTVYLPGEVAPSDLRKLDDAKIAFTVTVQFKSADAPLDVDRAQFLLCEKVNRGTVPCSTDDVIALRPNAGHGALIMREPREYPRGYHVFSLILDTNPHEISGVTLRLSDAIHAPIPDLYFSRAPFDYIPIQI